MTEGIKTVVYLGVALVISAAAWFTRPSDVEFQTADEISKLEGTPLFPNFDDPTKASGLEIVSVDQTVGQLERFEVTRDAQGLWTIPSHNGYPADAENQMRDVSVLFIDLPILAVVGTLRETHVQYGVVEPEEGENAGTEGVGRLVRITDKQDEKLVELIIGKPAKEREGDFEGQYFVRKPGQDVVYVAALDPSKLSTKFEDWIEKDLLKLNAFDVTGLHVEDYSVIGSIESDASGRRFLKPEQNKQFEAALDWNAEKGNWNLASFTSFAGGQTTDGAPEGEQLNTARLNELKNSLDDLKIIDVRRKPEGLGANLRADEDFMKDIESLQSLIDMGFYPIASEEGEPYELRAANGEVHVAMKDGVEYILRFGNTAGTEKDAADKLSRYLFVTARFDESRIPLPEKPGQQPAAGAEDPAEAAEQSTSPEAGAEEAEAEDAPAESSDAAVEASAAPEATEGDEAPAEAPTETPAAEPAAEDSGAAGSAGATFVSTNAQETATQETATQEPAEQEPAEEQAPAQDGPADEAAADAQAEDAAPPVVTDPAAAEAAPPADAAAQPAAQPVSDEEAAAAQQQQQRDYQRKLDERAKKIKDGKQRVAELNDRFADWYYIISEDVYKKIHLTRDELFQQPKGEGDGVDDFRELEQQGLEGGGLPGLPGLPSQP